MSMLPSRSIYEKGQAILLVLLSLAVVLTVGLSVVSRSLTDISVSTKEEEALRAFSAAEAGIERALIVGSNINETIGNATFSATVSGFASGTDVVFPQTMMSGESVTLWLVNHADDGSLVCNASKPCFFGATPRIRVCWGNSGTGINATTPAIEASVFYLATPGSYGTTRIARMAIDPNTSRQGTNRFSSPDAGTCSIAGTTFQFRKEIDFASLGVPSLSYTSQNGLQFVRLTILYNTDVAHGAGAQIVSGSPLPPQGIKIESTGTSGDSNRKIEIVQSFGEVPSSFDGAVYSETGLTK